MVKVILLAAGLYSNPGSLDSLRMETINGQACVIHQVDAKETLYSLSRRYSVTVTRLLEFNPTADGGLEVGQLLKIPYVSRKQSADGMMHKVQPKETLFSISRMYSIPIDDLKAWNNITDNAISVGQELLVRKKDHIVEVKPAETKQMGIKPNEVRFVKMTHSVAPGETLFSISRLYGVSVDQVKTWNGLVSDELKLSQVLYITQPMFQQQKELKPKEMEPVQKQEAKTSAQVVRQDPATTTREPVVAGSPIKISESVLGTDEVHELGLAELIDGTEGNRKYLALHRTAKEGSILKVRNELNNREVFVRVAGGLPNTGVNDKLVIKISKSAYDRLGAIDPKFRVEVTYYK